MHVRRGALIGIAALTMVGCSLSLGSTDLGSAEGNVPLPARSSGGDDAGGAAETTNDAGGTTTDGGTKEAGSAGPLKAFVSSTLVTGNGIGGLAGADAICNKAAAAAGLPGTYTAWISTTTVNAIDRIKANGPWQLVNGTKIAKDRGDLTKGSLEKRFDKDEKGNTLPDEEDRVWTGTKADGKAASSTCNDWSAGGTEGKVGEAAKTDEDWTALKNESCTEVNRVYCLQQ